MSRRPQLERRQAELVAMIPLQRLQLRGQLVALRTGWLPAAREAVTRRPAMLVAGVGIAAVVAFGSARLAGRIAVLVRVAKFAAGCWTVARLASRAAPRSG